MASVSASTRPVLRCVVLAGASRPQRVARPYPCEAMWSCASISPGIRVRPATSTISAVAGQVVAALGPAAMMRSPSMTTAASCTGVAPVPSIKVAPVRTRTIFYPSFEKPSGSAATPRST